MARARSARQTAREGHFIGAEAESAEGLNARLHVCNHPECRQEARFPAPKSREPRDGRYWFCLEHVRQYNLGWDFFRGMSPEEVEQYQREDVIGHRPTWTFGTKSAEHGGEEPQVWVKDDLGILADVGIVLNAGRRHRAEPVFEPREREALLELDFDLQTLKPPLRWADIKAQYKVMVKRYHPDANGGDREAEERLKTINQAYAYLETRGYT